MTLIIKHAVRRLANAPGFSVLAVLMLALGVAMSTSAFSVTNGTLLRELPFHDPQQLVRVATVSPKEFTPALSPGNAMDLRDQLRDVGDFGLFMQQDQNVSEPGNLPERQPGMSVSVDVLPLLGVRPAIGRGFLPGEDRPDQPPVILLTDRFWREHFGADRGVLGKPLRVETTTFTIVGVLPPSFDEPLLWRGCKFVTLMTVWPGWRTERAAKWMSVMGRLRPGVSRGFAQVRLEAFAREMARDHPVEMGADSFRISPLGSSFAGPETHVIYWMVVALAVLVLVIACANLGGVQLARAFGRQSELAVRVALGASRFDLVAVLAAESILIALVGTGLGVLLTRWSGALVSHWLDGPVLALDHRVILFAVLAGALATVCLGIVPAWLTSGSTAQALKEASRGSTAGRSRNRLKSALVIGQLALALTLVSTAALIVLGVRAFVQRDRGWRPEGLVSGAFRVTWDRVLQEQKEIRLPQLVEERLGALPGVESVAVTSDVLVYGDIDTEPLFVDGLDASVPGREPRVDLGKVNAAFFRTLGIPVREGRLLPPAWRHGDPPVAVVNATMARHFWPNGSAIGKRIRFGTDGPWHEIIGVVGDTSFTVGYSPAATPFQVYQPIGQAQRIWYSFVLRSHQPAIALERSIRSALGGIDSDMMVLQIGDMPQRLAEFASAGPLTGILVAFAVAGLIIALVGLYGVMSQFTEQRRREIGVRLALGASRSQVAGMMLARGAGMLAIGGVVGTAGAYAVALVFHRALPALPMLGVAGDALIGLALVAAGLGACYLPSVRAARVDPVEILRSE